MTLGAFLLPAWAIFDERLINSVGRRYKVSVLWYAPSENDAAFQRHASSTLVPRWPWC